MAEDVAELETRPAESKQNEKPDPAPTRENDDQSQQKDGKANEREVKEADKLPAPPQMLM
jgi:membrane fusion protein (multidrug efflux system)